MNFVRRIIVAIAIVAGGLGQPSMAESPPAGVPTAIEAKIAGDRLRTRIVVQFDRAPRMKTFLLDRPERLVIDLEETAFGFSEADGAPQGLVTRFQYGNMGAGHSRIILTAAGPFAVDRAEFLANESGAGVRLAVDLSATSTTAFADEVARQNAEFQSAYNPAGGTDGAAIQPGSDDGVFTIMLDPGHGGIDNGAKGLSGTREKDITLAFAQQLRDELAGVDGFEVRMTRDRDIFLTLDERVRLARQHGADLFVSLHADTINLRDIRGATVYTISEDASDEVARQVATQENLSDAIAGVTIEPESQEVADILIDLARRETLGFSVKFARMAVDGLGSVTHLINNPHRSAGFRVLRAHDVPSVLVELGYLSNRDDEKLLTDTEWRQRVADRLAHAIEEFSRARRNGNG